MESNNDSNSNKPHTFENKLVEFLATQQIGRSLYAPFWYIDDFTNSFIEIKNNLDLELTLMPLITLNGSTMALDKIIISPLSTVQVDLKSQPQIARLACTTL